MVQCDATIAATNSLYDELMLNPLYVEFYQQSGFANYGYWEEQTTGARQACLNLVGRVLDRMPNKTGAILDVACGKGETTRCLTAHYSADAITAINISDRQLEVAAQRVPGASFQRMDATRMTFPDATFDNVLCIEAAFHFDTRQEFFAEALRVLKPGGVLAMSDILMSREAEQTRPHHTEKNYLAGPQEYAALLREVGFGDVRVDDITEESWNRFFRYLVRYLHEKFLQRQISLETLKHFLDRNYRNVQDLEYYVIVSAQK